MIANATLKQTAPPVQFNPLACQKRKQKDIMKLLMSDYKVTPNPQDSNEMTVIFHGPKESCYKTGVWEVSVLIPDQYPYKSPSIGFKNKIFHPNIDEQSGSVCLDVINQAWSPMYDLTNVFDIFLPQLLNYPNPKDPLNADAAALLIFTPDIYRIKAKQYVIKYANGDPSILNIEKIRLKKEGSIEEPEKKLEETNEEKNKVNENDDDEEEEEKASCNDEKISNMSEVSELSKTSNIDLLEEGY